MRHFGADRLGDNYSAGALPLITLVVMSRRYRGRMRTTMKVFMAPSHVSPPGSLYEENGCGVGTCKVPIPPLAKTGASVPSKSLSSDTPVVGPRS